MILVGTSIVTLHFGQDQGQELEKCESFLVLIPPQIVIINYLK